MATENARRWCLCTRTRNACLSPSCARWTSARSSSASRRRSSWSDEAVWLVFTPERAPGSILAPGEKSALSRFAPGTPNDAEVSAAWASGGIVGGATWECLYVRAGVARIYSVSSPRVTRKSKVLSPRTIRRLTVRLTPAMLASQRSSFGFFTGLPSNPRMTSPGARPA